MKKYSLDTNCFIDFFSPNLHAYESLARIFALYHKNNIKIMISRHTLDEIPKQKHISNICEVFNFSETIPILDHYPIGDYDEQIASWNNCCGTWNDAKKNQKRQEKLLTLAKSGNDIRDRGAFIDALLNDMDAFITSDKQLVGNGPKERIKTEFDFDVLKPQELIKELE